MNLNEKLTLARILKRITDRAAGGAILAKDAMQIVEEELQAIATESAPAAGAVSIETPEFNSLTLTHASAVARGSLADVRNAWTLLIGHIDNWGAQQHEAGRRDMHETNVSLLDENMKLRERAEKAEAALEEWRFTNKIDELQRAHDALLARAKKAEAALAQRAAGETNSPHDICRASERKLRDTILELQQQQLAARAVGGVDELEEFRKWMSNNGQSAIYIGDGLFEGIANDMYSAWRGRAELSSAPAAPVGDGDEREIVRKARKQVVIDGHMNSALDAIMTSDSPDGKFCILGALVDQAIRAALTQQKGS